MSFRQSLRRSLFGHAFALAQIACALLIASCSGGAGAPPSGDDPGPRTIPGTAGAQGTPCEPWATRACGIELGTFDGRTSCATGIQVCEGGSWGTCMADASRGVTSVPAAPVGGGSLAIQVVGGSSTNCVDNPCDPYCRIFQDTPDAAITADRVNAVTGWLSGGTLSGSNVPSAFKDKGSLNTQCTATAGSDTWNEACQFDQHCVGSACVAFGVAQSGSCAGVDITAPTTCIPGTGFRDVTVCNRGTVAAPPGVKCYLYAGGSPRYPEDDPGLGSLIMTTATTLAAGTCETQPIAENLFNQNGIQSLMCNPPQTNVSLQECNQANNWTATKLVPDPDPCRDLSTPSYAPFTVSRVFQAVCAAGTSPQWKQFGYTTSTPSGTKVEFRFRSFEATNGTCVALSPVTSDPPVPLATASLTQDPEVCSIAGTGNPCPKNLYDGLGKLPYASYACLQMDARGIPTISAAPQLINWTATYDCVPSQ